MYKEIEERMERLNKEIPRYSSSLFLTHISRLTMSAENLDLELEMEDQVGIGSVRKVKNLISLTGKHAEDEEETKKMNEKAQEFIKKKEEERKNIAKKRKSRIRKQQLLEQKYKEEQEKKRIEELEKRKEKVIQQCKESEDKRLQHQKEREANKGPVVLDRDYMHEKLQKKYHDQFVVPSLEQKKMQLENLRNFHKPINREELDEHEKKFLETLKLKQDEKRLKREREYKEWGIGVSLISVTPALQANHF